MNADVAKTFIETLPSILMAFAAVIGAIGGIIIGFRNGRKIEQVHQGVNSKMEELIASTKQASFAEGREQGRLDEK